MEHLIAPPRLLLLLARIGDTFLLDIERIVAATLRRPLEILLLVNGSTLSSSDSAPKYGIGSWLQRRVETESSGIAVVVVVVLAPRSAQQNGRHRD